MSGRRPRVPQCRFCSRRAACERAQRRASGGGAISFACFSLGKQRKAGRGRVTPRIQDARDRRVHALPRPACISPGMCYALPVPRDAPVLVARRGLVSTPITAVSTPDLDGSNSPRGRPRLSDEPTRQLLRQRVAEVPLRFTQRVRDQTLGLCCPRWGSGGYRGSWLRSRAAWLPRRSLLWRIHSSFRDLRSAGVSGNLPPLIVLSSMKGCWH